MSEAFRISQSNDLKSLSDSVLHERTFQCARREQQATIDLLHHLYEVNRRRLFAKRAYASLWEYVVRELNYSEAAASDRVNAMRLIFSVPEAMEKLADGKLSLTAAAKVQRHFQQGERLGKPEARYAPEEKARLVLEVAGQSTRDAEKIFLAERTERSMPWPEKMRLIAPELTELRLDANNELMKKIERVKELKGELGLAEIFSRALDAYLETEDPLKKLKRAELRAQRKIERERGAIESTDSRGNPAMGRVVGEAYPAGNSMRAPESPDVHGSTRAPESASAPQTLPAPKNPRSRYIAAAIRANAWTRAQGQCEYRDSKTGARCHSHLQLQYEHVQPFAKGGTSETSNIQLLCPQHNRFRALQAYGAAKMRPFLLYRCGKMGGTTPVKARPPKPDDAAPPPKSAPSERSAPLARIQH